MPDPSALILYAKLGRPPRPGEHWMIGDWPSAAVRGHDAYEPGWTDERAVVPIPAAEALERQVEVIATRFGIGDQWTRNGIREQLLAALLGPADEPPEWARECAREWKRLQCAPAGMADLSEDAHARHIARCAKRGGDHA